jgi:lipopolysaccharide export system protein LptA
MHPCSVEANAQTITYFINQQLVRLEGNAHLVQGFDSFSGGILNYDIKKDKVFLQHLVPKSLLLPQHYLCKC